MLKQNPKFKVFTSMNGSIISEEIIKHLKQDKVLAEVIQTIPQPTIWSTKNVFHDLLSCVLEQQIHYRSSKKTFQKLLNKAGLEEINPSNFELFEEKALPNYKLSSQKQETLVAILSYWEENQTDWKTLSEKEVKSELKTIKGIGPWTIDMILMYTLQKPDILPSGDYHLNELMVKLYGLNPETKLQSQIKEIANDWMPYRSLAVRYLFDWKTFQKANKL